MLRNLLESAGLNAKVCADLLGLDHIVFRSWIAGERPIPSYIVPELCSVLGVSSDALLAGISPTKSSIENAPAIWFRFRSGDRLTDVDRELVVVIRKLGHHMDELEELTGTRAVSWSVVFDGIRKEVDKQSSPLEQGRAAGRFLRGVRELGLPVRTREGIKGIGDRLRDNIRCMGVRIVESPLPSSNLEGCSFYVGPPGSEKPCLFANSYKQTWFRRNMILAHELAHAIFDIETNAASVDFTSDSEQHQLEELRADAFAQEVLAPKEVLNHIAQTNGIKWRELTSNSLALFVAYTQVEKRVVIKAALDAGFIDAEQADRYREIDIHDDLRALSERALTTQEYVRSKSLSNESIISAESRTTTIPSRALRLPLPYVSKVIELARLNDITFGKAAQMLMIDKRVLLQRFGSQLKEAAA